MTWVYTWVVVIDECPRSSWMALMSAPLVSSVVANECLSVWAETSFTIPAWRARLETVVVMKLRDSLTSSDSSAFFLAVQILEPSDFSSS